VKHREFSDTIMITIPEPYVHFSHYLT